MTEPHWVDIVSQASLDQAKDALWVKVVDFVHGPRRFRIQANGTWKYRKDAECGPDGKSAEGLDDSNIHKQALRGCLLAKVGGSPGDLPAAEKIVAVGSYCVFDIAENQMGALYLSMNDTPKRFFEHSGKLSVTISESACW